MWMGATRRELNACVMCQICSKIENGSHLNFCAGLFQNMTAMRLCGEIRSKNHHLHHSGNKLSTYLTDNLTSKIVR